MRGLRKPWPPKDVSPEGHEPRTLREAEKDLLAKLRSKGNPAEHARAVFDSLEKRKLRDVLYREQGGLCVYCERRVSENDRHPPQVDHWRPLNARPEFALRWENLHLSCATDTTCDSRKGGAPLRADPHDDDLPWPVHLQYERCIGFTSAGEAYVRADAPLTAAQRRALVLALGRPHDDKVKGNSILNLNDPALVAARSGALDGERLRLQRKYKGRTATREERAALAATLLEDRPLREYVSIRVRWLDGSLGKSR